MLIWCWLLKHPLLLFLCYTIFVTLVRCTWPVSLVPPAYYTHLAALEVRSDAVVTSRTTLYRATPLQTTPLPKLGDGAKRLMGSWLETVFCVFLLWYILYILYRNYFKSSSPHLKINLDQLADIFTNSLSLPLFEGCRCNLNSLNTSGHA